MQYGTMADGSSSKESFLPLLPVTHPTSQAHPNTKLIPHRQIKTPSLWVNPYSRARAFLMRLHDTKNKDLFVPISVMLAKVEADIESAIRIFEGENITAPTDQDIINFYKNGNAGLDIERSE
jgi:hypothetical protein